MRRRRSRKAKAREQLRATLMRVSYFTPYPRFVCDVFLDNDRIGSFAQDTKGYVTFDRHGRRFGRRKQVRRSAIVAIVAKWHALA